MRRYLTPLLMILTALALALPAGSTLAAHRGVTIAALLPEDENWSEIGATQGGLYGQSVAGAGDIDDDGFADIIIGSPFYTEDGEKIGAAFVYFGSTNGILDEDVKLTSNTKGSEFGAAVSSAGDVNGDGYDDVIVGAPMHHVAVEHEGAAYLFYGSMGGLSTMPAWSKTGNSADAQFGCAVAGAGDVNNDGYDDVLIGSCNYSNDTGNLGAVHLFYGSLTGLRASAEPFSDWVYLGPQAGSRLGASLAGLGDLNQDGYADFAVGAPFYDDFGYIDIGLVHVFLGAEHDLPQTPFWTAYGSRENELYGFSIDGAGDVDANNFVDFIIGARGYNILRVEVGGVYLITNSGGILTQAPVKTGPSNSGYGASVAGLGDVNNDGYADVAVGAPTCDSLTDNEEGCVFVYRGSELGLPYSHAWLGYGGKAETQFGLSVDGAGDVNGDGFDDLIVGAPIFKSDNKIPLGKASVFHGTDAADSYRFFLPVVTRQ